MTAATRSVLLLLLVAMFAGCAAPDPDAAIGTSESDVTAQGFHKELVLHDEHMTDADALSPSQIQAFLENTPWGTRSVLADHTSNGVSAAQAIHDAGELHRISPVMLLTRLQLEQSLVGRASATNNALKWAMGCGCPDGQACYAAYAGFDRQVTCAAERMRSYLDALASGGSTIAGWQVGVGRRTLDGYTIRPRNRATAAIYTYTPWASSARNHYLIWNTIVAHLDYEAPAPGGCGTIGLAQKNLQLRPDAALESEFAGQRRCFLDVDVLTEPSALQLVVEGTSLAPHFTLGEFVSASSSRRMLLEPALVEALEATRVALGSPITVDRSFRSPAALANECATCATSGTCPASCDTGELSHGTAALVSSHAGHQALLAAASSVGVTSCWTEGGSVYVGVGTSRGCPAP